MTWHRVPYWDKTMLLFKKSSSVLPPGGYAFCGLCSVKHPITYPRKATDEDAEGIMEKDRNTRTCVSKIISYLCHKHVNQSWLSRSGFSYKFIFLFYQVIYLVLGLQSVKLGLSTTMILGLVGIWLNEILSSCHYSLSSTSLFISSLFLSLFSSPCLCLPLSSYINNLIFRISCAF